MGPRERSPEDINRAAWSARWTLRWFRGFDGWSDDGEQVVISLLADEMRGRPILDLGVGAGRTIPILRAISDDYVALDFLPAMVDISRTKYPDARVLVGDARDLSAFETESFSLVVFSWNGLDAIAHEDRRLVLQEVHRVLQPGGAFVYSTHNKRGPGYGEAPWKLSRRTLAHPRRAAKFVARMPVGVVRYWKHRQLAQDTPDWGVRNAAAHQFGLVIHYTTLEGAVHELQKAGFTSETAIFDCADGRRILPGEDTSDVFWFHLIARK
jgi:ubiquinone/menaquinone biosynthesis C-methylase UbiE